METILLIINNAETNINIAEILALSGYKVIAADNGKIGLEKAIAHLPSLIICETLMPVLDGFGVLQAIKNNISIKNIPIILLTDTSEKNEFRKCMELGADDYISKPFNATELLIAVNTRIKKVNDLKNELVLLEKERSGFVRNFSDEKIVHQFIEGRNHNTYKRKQHIYTEGNHCNMLYYIIKGKAVCYKRNEDGKELVTEMLASGDFLGYISLLEGCCYKDSVKVLEESIVAAIPGEDFNELLNTYPNALKYFMHILTKRNSVNELRMLSIAFNSLRKKVAKTLILLSEKYKQDGEKFTINMNRESLAAIAGTAKESLIRTLYDFKNELIIEICSNGSIEILDKKKLVNMHN